MRSIASHFVTTVLVIAFAGASHVCVCLATMAASPSAAATDEHACCRASDASQKPAQDPCESCPAKQMLDQVAPERTLTYLATSLAVELWTAPTMLAIANVSSPLTLAVHDTIPPPPILQDLFHSACLLTV
jgi:hypothetical protein